MNVSEWFINIQGFLDQNPKLGWMVAGVLALLMLGAFFWKSITKPPKCATQNDKLLDLVNSMQNQFAARIYDSQRMYIDSIANSQKLLTSTITAMVEQMNNLCIQLSPADED